MFHVCRAEKRVAINEIIFLQNTEVLKSVTVPNVILNFDHTIIPTRCKFYAGDWASLATLLDESKKYDYIFTSETIYNPDNHKKLYEIFKTKLKADGTVWVHWIADALFLFYIKIRVSKRVISIRFVAGKTYYFGVGGGMRQFENLILKDGSFDVKSVWRSQDGD